MLKFGWNLPLKLAMKTRKPTQPQTHPLVTKGLVPDIAVVLVRVSIPWMVDKSFRTKLQPGNKSTAST